jgi:hypothetical protein
MFGRLQKIATGGFSRSNRIIVRNLFYECSSYSLAKHERSLIEKSVNAGCTTFFTRSSPHFNQLYEHLADLQYELNDSESTTDNGEKKKFTLGHIITSPKSVPDNQVDQFMKQELNQLIAGLEKNSQSLNYLSISFPSSAWESREVVSSLSQLLPAYSSFLDSSKTKIGLDLSTRLLTTLSADQISPVLRPLVEQQFVDFVTLATNPFSSSTCYSVRDSISDISSSFEVFGTELLRLHPTKPGQISPNYNYKFPHHYRYNDTSPSQDDVSKNIGEGELTAKEQEAVSDVRAALDRAVTIEKVFLEKFADKARAMKVSVADICLGHMMTQVHGKLTFVEEYEHFLAAHMDPFFEKAVDIITRSDSDMRDWVALYRPMGHYMQASFRNLLQLRQLQLIRRIGAQLEHGHKGPLLDTKNVPHSIAALAKQQFKLSDAGLSLMVVSPDLDTETRTSISSQKGAEAVYEKMRNICVDYESGSD